MAREGRCGACGTGAMMVTVAPVIMSRLSDTAAGTRWDRTPASEICMVASTSIRNGLEAVYRPGNTLALKLALFSPSRMEGEISVALGGEGLMRGTAINTHLQGCHLYGD